MSDDTARSTLNPWVFYPSSILIVVLLMFAMLQPDTAALMFEDTQRTVVASGSWFYVLSVAIILLVVVYLGGSRYGDIRLGPQHLPPDYSVLSWLSMLFAAGMGIGLMFFGVAEPLMHFATPSDADSGTLEAARDALTITFFHWGLHVWAIYAIVAVALAYFSFRRGLPLSIRSCLYPLIGDRIYGWMGNAVDVLAAISTIFGIATTLGLGAAQINAGLGYLLGIDVNASNQIWIVLAVTSVAVLSVMSGLDRGIRRLSEANMGMSIALLIFVLAVGPTVFLLQAYVQNTGAYLVDIVHNTFNLFAYQPSDWLGNWTILYWAWWIAWAPFVGVFIARISRGRTIREFVLGVLLAPTAFNLLWMTVFGNSALDLVMNQGQQHLLATVSENSDLALFVFLEHYPFSDFLAGLAILMIIVFFVTSCDSGAMVIDMWCSHGNNNTPLWQRIYWAIGVGVVAVILLLVGGLSTLQTMTMVTALPFVSIIMLAIWGLLQALRLEGHQQASLQLQALPAPSETDVDNWRGRLRNIVEHPTEAAVAEYIRNTAGPALRAVADELQKYQLAAQLRTLTDGVELTVMQGSGPDFVFGVHSCQRSSLATAADAPTVAAAQRYYWAEVHLREGGQNYDVTGWSKAALINYVVDHYHKHKHFLHLLGGDQPTARQNSGQ